MVSSLTSEVSTLLLWPQEHGAGDVPVLLSSDNALKSEASVNRGAGLSAPSQALFSLLHSSLGCRSVVLTAGIVSGKEEAAAPSGMPYASDVPNINGVMWLCTLEDEDST